MNYPYNPPPFNFQPPFNPSWQSMNYPYNPPQPKLPNQFGQNTPMNYPYNLNYPYNVPPLNPYYQNYPSSWENCPQNQPYSYPYSSYPQMITQPFYQKPPNSQTFVPSQMDLKEIVGKKFKNLN